MKNTRTDPVTANHPATVAELRQAMKALFERERELINEGAANYAALQSGQPQSRPLSDHERRVAGHIQLLMNGATPQHLLQPAVSRDEQIRAEREAIAFVGRQLDRQMELAVYREAEQFALEHATQWRALCREIVLTAVKLASLEERAENMSRKMYGVSIAMGSTIGSGLSLLGDGDPLLDYKNVALQEGIVTNSEIRKAQQND